MRTETPCSPFAVAAASVLASSLLLSPPLPAQGRLLVPPAEAPTLAEAPPEHPPAAPGDAPCGRPIAIPDVYLHSGELHLSETDLVIKGRGLDFAWVRRYRSRLGVDTEQGHGWDFSYNLRIEPVGGNLRLRDGNGRRDLYRKQADSTYVAEQFFRVGVFNPDGTFTLTFADGGTWLFQPLDGSPAQGKVQEIADRNGNTLSFAYDTLGRLDEVTDTLGRKIRVGYDQNGRIASLTDFTGRQVVYDYYQAGEAGGGPGDLESARSPTVTGTPHGNNFPNGKTTVYTYSKGFADERLNHNLLTITDPEGQTWLTNTYSSALVPTDLSFDRLERQERGDPGDVIDVVYRSVLPAPRPTDRGSAQRIDVRHLLAIVNDRVGNVVEFTYDERGRCVRTRELTGRANPDQPTTATANRPTGPLRLGDPTAFETLYSYNRDSLVVRIVHPKGNITEKVYEEDLNPGAPWRSRGNLREIRRLPGSYTPVGGQTELVELFEYQAGVGGCCGSNFVTKHTDARGNLTQHTYDPNGNRIQTVHRISSIVEDFGYNEHGQLTSHRWPDNGQGHRQLDRWTYYDSTAGPQNGYLQSEILDSTKEALTTTWVHDAVGNALQTTDARGNVHDVIVNELDQVVREISPRLQVGGTQFRYETDTWYDANDNVVRVDRKNIDDQGVWSGANPYITTSYDYEILNERIRRTEEVDPATDVVTEFGYDANRNRILERSGEAVCGAQPFNVIERRYDERNLLFQMIRGSGGPDQSTTRYDYDANGLAVAEHRGLEGSPRITTDLRDAYGRSLVQTDPMGNTTTTGYDPNSNVVSVRVDGELCDVPGGVGNVRLYEVSMAYDAMDRLLSTDLAHFDPGTGNSIGDGSSRTVYRWTDRSEMASTTDDNGNTTRYSYDSVNRLEQVVDAAGNSVQRTYDQHDNLVRLTETEVSDLGGPSQVIRTSWIHDAVDRPVCSSDSLGNELDIGYDSRHNATRLVDALRNVTVLTFDGLDRVRSSTRTMTDTGTGAGTAIGKIERRWEWDCNSRIRRLIDDNTNATGYRYDDLNRRTAVDAADNTSSTCVFDVHGNIVFEVDANGTQVVSTYDGMDRIATRSITAGPGVSAETSFETWKHDGVSRVVHAQDDDSLVTRAYDSLSNVTSETQNGKTLTCAHDGVGNQLALVYPGGKRVNRTFDALNRVKTIANQGPTARYDYLGPNRVERRTTGAGIGGVARSTYRYDGARRVLSIDHRTGGGFIDLRAFAWDAQYNRIQASDQRPGGPQRTFDYAYDSQYRLVRALVTDQQGTVRDERYTLDGVGNRVAVSGGSCPGAYVMDATQPEPADRQMNQYTNTPCIGCIEYDFNGNELLRAGTDTMVVNQRNRIVTHQSTVTGLTTTHAYDALGRVISRSRSDGREVHYYYAGPHVVQERDENDSVVAEYVRGPAGEIVEMVAGSARYFFFADDLQSTRVVTDGSGNVVERYEYDDYGNPTFFDGSGAPIAASAIGNHYLFTGQRFEPESGFYDYKARHFDPNTGRFLGRDPIGMWEDAVNLGNARAYVGNNPQTFVDPTGMWTDSVSCSGRFGSRPVRWTRDNCDSWDANRINQALCPGMRAAEQADLWAGLWATYELSGYPNAGSKLVAVPFLEWFAGPDRRVGLLSRIIIRDTLRDILRPFGWNITFECETSDGGLNNLCGANTVAYVISDHASDIHLCPPWNPLDRSQRAAVILHEYTHKFGGTEDMFYYPMFTSRANATPDWIAGGWGFLYPNTRETGTLRVNADTYRGMLQRWFLP